MGRKTRGQDRLPPEHPDPSVWAGPGKAGLKRGRSQAELGPRRLPRTLPAGASGAGPEAALGAAPPRPGRAPGGGPADRPRVSRGCTERVGPSKRAQPAVAPGRSARGQVPAGPSCDQQAYRPVCSNPQSQVTRMGLTFACRTCRCFSRPGTVENQGPKKRHTRIHTLRRVKPQHIKEIHTRRKVDLNQERKVNHTPHSLYALTSLHLPRIASSS